MGDQDDQETPFEEMDAHQLAAKTAWARFFIREVSKRGYTIEEIVALLDEPGMTVEAAVQRILSTSKPAYYPRLNPSLRPGCRTWRKSGDPLSRFTPHLGR